MLDFIVLHGRKFKRYLTEEQIAREIARMAEEIDDKLENSNVVVVPVLNGAYVFAADLLRAMTLDAELGFVKLASYDGMGSTGSVEAEVFFDPATISGKDVLIMEDIIETGETLTQLQNILREAGAASIHVACLLLKSDRNYREVGADFVGFRIPDDFVVGYGMDFDGLGRTLADIYQLDE